MTSIDTLWAENFDPNLPVSLDEPTLNQIELIFKNKEQTELILGKLEEQFKTVPHITIARTNTKALVLTNLGNIKYAHQWEAIDHDYGTWRNAVIVLENGQKPFWIDNKILKYVQVNQNQFFPVLRDMQ